VLDKYADHEEGKKSYKKGSHGHNNSGKGPAEHKEDVFKQISIPEEIKKKTKFGNINLVGASSIAGEAMKFAAVIQTSNYAERKNLIEKVFRNQIPTWADYFESRTPATPCLDSLLNEDERSVSLEGFMVEVLFKFMEELMKINFLMNTSQALVVEYEL